MKNNPELWFGGQKDQTETGIALLCINTGFRFSESDYGIPQYKMRKVYLESTIIL